MATGRPWAAAATALALLLAAAATITMPSGTAGYSTLTVFSGPGCSGKTTTYQCGYHQITTHGGFRFRYAEGYPLLVLRFPGRGDGARRALLSPITTRYVSDAQSCDIPDRHYAQMSC
uniref:Antimicrobial peptide 1 n=1 Tax=Anthurium amnicola TaxID=1678845 RepID=A0A1D1Z3N3_9ARAE